MGRNIWQRTTCFLFPDFAGAHIHCIAHANCCVDYSSDLLTHVNHKKRHIYVKLKFVKTQKKRRERRGRREREKKSSIANILLLRSSFLLFAYKIHTCQHTHTHTQRPNHTPHFTFHSSTLHRRQASCKAKLTLHYVPKVYAFCCCMCIYRIRRHVDSFYYYYY